MGRMIGAICGSRRAARRMADDLRGTTAIEYALMAGCISLAIISTVFTVGEQVKSNFYDKLLGLF
jgi:Flp pilus assembly pilin Flp